MNERADLENLGKFLDTKSNLKIEAQEAEEQWSCKEQHEVCIALGTFYQQEHEALKQPIFGLSFSLCNNSRSHTNVYTCDKPLGFMIAIIH